MAGGRQTTDMIRAKGRKHMTRAEEDARRDAEVRVPPPAKAKPPRWLPKELGREFRALGNQLLAVGLFTSLDADTLGRYLVAHHEYLAATAEVQRALTPPRDSAAAETWGRVQERYFKQARNCANDMGLTVTSRCRLVLPEVMQTAASAADERPSEFMERLAARQAALGGE